MKYPIANPNSRRAVADWSTYALIVVWLMAAAVGWYSVERYEFATTDALVTRAVEHWPADTKLDCSADRSTLVLFLHPKCPCSRATLAEMDRVLATSGKPAIEQTRLIVVATVPPNADDSWRETSTLGQARALPNAEVFIDHDGREAARFGATTSGIVMFFDARGTRRYAGGITITRGHQGRSAGGDVIQALVRGEPVKPKSMPAFGCRLCLPEVVPAQDSVGQKLGISHTAAEVDASI